MKILLVGQSYWPRKNGISSVMTTLAEGLVRRGHAVEVATEYDAARNQACHNGVRIHSFRVTGNGMTGLRGDWRSFRHFIETGDWTVQHHHACQIWCFDALRDWLPRRNRPVVVTPHGFSQLANPAWKPYFDEMAGLLCHLDAVTCLSESFEEVPYLRQLGYTRYQVIHNGVDPAEFQSPPVRNLRQEWGLGNRLWVLNVSNHVRPKGHRTLYELARRLPEAQVVNIGNANRPDRFGLGRLGLRSPCYYECRLQARLIPNFLTKAGTSRPTVVSAYRQADVFVLPSAREASPVVLLEAMAAGLPWVAFDVGNVRTCKGGFVVSSVAEMAEAIREIGANRALAQELSAQAVAHVREHHGLDRIIDEYASLYARVTDVFSSPNHQPV